MEHKKRAKGRVGRVRTVIDEPILPDEGQEDDPFRMALEEFGESEALTLQVYRYDSMTGKARYAKSVPFERKLHGLEWLQRFFGAGDYLLRFYDSEGKSKNRTVSVDDPPGAKKEPEPAPAASNRNDELVSVLREQNAIFLKALLDRGPQAAATESPVTLKILDALLPSALAKPDISGTLLSMFEKGIGIAMETKSEGEGGMAGLLRTVAKELAPVLQEFARARMMAPPMPPVRVTPPPMPTFPMPSPSPATPPASPPSSPPPPMPSSPEEAAKAMIEGTVRLGVEIIEPAWRAKEKPEDVGDWILGEIAPNYYDHLSGLDFERLTAIHPRYAQIDRPWLEQVLSHIREVIARGDEDEHAETG